LSYPGQHVGNFRPSHLRDPILNAPITKPDEPVESTDHGTVLMLYGLCSKKANATRVFNILCLFGNVRKVKFLMTKEGCAMVQMNNPAEVDQV
jgi:hypothetical protein